MAKIKCGRINYLESITSSHCAPVITVNASNFGLHVNFGPHVNVGPLFSGGLAIIKTRPTEKKRKVVEKKCICKLGSVHFWFIILPKKLWILDAARKTPKISMWSKVIGFYGPCLCLKVIRCSPSPRSASGQI
jgi:hypothetical protein